MSVIWQVCDVNDRYEVSTEGGVRRTDTGRVLKPSLTHNGYRYVQLWANGKGTNWRINRLVLVTFTGLDPDPTKVQVAHLNGDRIDNRVDNLAWKDTRGNYLDRLEHGTQVCITRHNTRLTPDDVALMRNQFANGVSQATLSKRFGVSKSHVSKTVNGHRWKN